jgi:tetratricopeptide (TPR) repeat protein
MKHSRLMVFILTVLAFLFQISGVAQADEASALENRLKNAPEGQKTAIAFELGEYYLKAAFARLQTGDERQARDYFDKTSQLYQVYSDQNNMVALYHRIANEYYHRKIYDQAVRYLNQGQQMALKLRADGPVLANYQALAAVYVAAGKTDQALDAYEKYSEVKTRIAEAKLRTELGLMRTRYEKAQKRKEAESAKRFTEMKIYLGFLLGIVVVIGCLAFRMRQGDRKAFANQDRKLQEALKTLQSAQRRLESAERVADIGDLAMDHIRQVIPELTALKAQLAGQTPATEGEGDVQPSAGDNPEAVLTVLEKIIDKLKYFQQVAGF